MNNPYRKPVINRSDIVFYGATPGCQRLQIIINQTKNILDH